MNNNVIKTLRWKLFGFTLSFVALLMLAIFFSICFASYRSNEQEIEQSLEWALELTPLRNHKSPGVPTYTLIYDAWDESYTLFGDERNVLIDKVQLIELAEQAKIDQREKKDDLIYEKHETRRGYITGFVETEMQSEQLHTLIFQCVQSFIFILLLFGTASWFASRWILKPVWIAWEKQKQFVSDASHELKTPLTILKADTQSLLEQEPNNEIFLSLYEETNRMQRLIFRLLELARLESNPKEEKERFDFSSLCQKIILEKEEGLYEQGIELEAKIQDHLFIKANQHDLEDLVLILMDNAQKYTPKEGRIEFNVQKADSNALFSIANPGTLSKEEQEKIFERFYKVDSSRTNSESYGLGLAIAKEISRRNDLNLRVHCDNDQIRFLFEAKLV